MVLAKFSVQGCRFLLNLDYYNRWWWWVVGNKPKGRISKRVFQENKARQIFSKSKTFFLGFYESYISKLSVSGCILSVQCEVAIWVGSYWEILAASTCNGNESPNDIHLTFTLIEIENLSISKCFPLDTGRKLNIPEIFMPIYVLYTGDSSYLTWNRIITWKWFCR